uniref:NADH-ubiquinone oxidoreductase chain 5 n=1 Tax=Chamaeleo zeylanicus TaxID=420384 RepID=B7S6B2_CHAZE|nr:NADH dehydrogenase subunit 5 [Chamaeleo zeylanicus]ABM89692.1 NADH dehydrogenase subunit 5 [Chamaeleo zeylanicus]
MNSTLELDTTMILTLTILSTLVLFTPILQKTTKFNLSPETTVMSSFMISTIPTMLSLKLTPHNTSINLATMQISTLNIHSTISTNLNSNLFLTIALFVTWAIMQFSTWYMKNTPKIKLFKKYLMAFLIAMIILMLAGSMIQLFIGWEAVGIMSFLLINWWYARTCANSSAMQAMTYNRIGDIGIILTLAWLATNQTSWDMQAMDPHMNTTMLTIGLILAATGKSAQFFMHMWLPSAMEGPTPVSALLHSSTMVVAGIYLLTQMHHTIKYSSTSMNICLWLGTTTSLYASMTAICQNDLKKIIAMSTLSQLGLMMTAIGLNQPNLSFMHISTHASTKAALFLCAGSFIHNLQNEQDIRKMGNMKTMLPITSTCLVITSLALMGMPFLSCFYSKDPIMETTYMSKMNTWILTMVMTSTAMTSTYSMRMIYYTLTKYNRNKPTMMIKETTNQINPIIRLTILSIMAGTMLSIATTQTTSDPTIPTTMKLTPILAMLTGIYLTIEIMNKPTTHTQKQKNSLLTLMNQLAFFKITHRWTPKNTMKMGTMIATQLIDSLWLEKTGPKTIELMNKNTAKLTNPLTGLMKLYLSSTAITTTLALLMTHLWLMAN